MSRLPDLAERIERLVLRHDELKRTNALLEQQLHAVTEERDNLRSRLAAARSRIDSLIDRLPAEVTGGTPAAGHSATASAATDDRASTPVAGPAGHEPGSAAE
jgi:uncharacterized protein (TIGR02449 family)